MDMFVFDLRILLVLSDEMKTCMRLLGAKTVGDLGPQHVRSSCCDGFCSYY